VAGKSPRLSQHVADAKSAAKDLCGRVAHGSLGGFLRLRQSLPMTATTDRATRRANFRFWLTAIAAYFGTLILILLIAGISSGA
jgi:hypothetical protein